MTRTRSPPRSGRPRSPPTSCWSLPVPAPDAAITRPLSSPGSAVWPHDRDSRLPACRRGDLRVVRRSPARRAPRQAAPRIACAIGVRLDLLTRCRGLGPGVPCSGPGGPALGFPCRGLADQARRRIDQPADARSCLVAHSYWALEVRRRRAHRRPADTWRPSVTHADRTYRVRQALAADPPAVLAILTENRAELPHRAVPRSGRADRAVQENLAPWTLTTSAPAALSSSSTLREIASADASPS